MIISRIPVSASCQEQAGILNSADGIGGTGYASREEITRFHLTTSRLDGFHTHPEPS